MKKRFDPMDDRLKPADDIGWGNETQQPTEHKASDKIKEVTSFILGAFRRPSFFLGVFLGYLFNHFVFRPLFFK